MLFNFFFTLILTGIIMNLIYINLFFINFDIYHLFYFQINKLNINDQFSCLKI